MRHAGEDGWTALASKVVGVEVAAGSHLRLETAGGGGHGPPDERDAGAAAADRAQGYVSDGD